MEEEQEEQEEEKGEGEGLLFQVFLPPNYLNLSSPGARTLQGETSLRHPLITVS